MEQNVAAGNSFICMMRSVFRNAFHRFLIRRRRIIVKNKIAHIVDLMLKIKKGVWKKHPSLENHATLILDTCDILSPEGVDIQSREIICGASLFIGQCLQNEILPKTQQRAHCVFDRFRNYGGVEVSSGDLKEKFSKWFAH